MKKKIINVVLFLFAAQIDTAALDLKLRDIKRSSKFASLNKTVFIESNKMILFCVFSILMPKPAFLFMICSVLYYYKYQIKIDFLHIIIICLLSLLLKYFNFRLHILILLVYLICNTLYLAIDAFCFKAQKILIVINIVCIFKILIFIFTYQAMFRMYERKPNHELINVRLAEKHAQTKILYFIVADSYGEGKRSFKTFPCDSNKVAFYPRGVNGKSSCIYSFDEYVEDACYAYKEAKSRFADSEIVIYGYCLGGAIALKLAEKIKKQNAETPVLIIDRCFNNLSSVIYNFYKTPEFITKIVLYILMDNLDSQKILNSLDSEIFIISSTRNYAMKKSYILPSKTTHKTIDFDCDHLDRIGINFLNYRDKQAQ